MTQNSNFGLAEFGEITITDTITGEVQTSQISSKDMIEVMQLIQKQQKIEIGDAVTMIDATTGEEIMTAEPLSLENISTLQEKVIKCSSPICHKEIKAGDKVYEEDYFYHKFCSLRCLINWSSQEYGWVSGIAKKGKYYDLDIDRDTQESLEYSVEAKEDYL